MCLSLIDVGYRQTEQRVGHLLGEAQRGVVEFPFEAWLQMRRHGIVYVGAYAVGLEMITELIAPWRPDHILMPHLA